MKRVGASEARRNWFRLLDEVVAGVVVAVERGGAWVVLRREDLEPGETTSPDYSELISAPNADRADEWAWTWEAPGGLKPVRAKR